MQEEIQKPSMKLDVESLEDYNGWSTGVEINGQNLEKHSVGVRVKTFIFIEASCWRWLFRLPFCAGIGAFSFDASGSQRRRWRGGTTSLELLVRANSGWGSSRYRLLCPTCDARLSGSVSLLCEKTPKAYDIEDGRIMRASISDLTGGFSGDDDRLGPYGTRLLRFPLIDDFNIIIASSGMGEWMDALSGLCCRLRLVYLVG